MIKRDNSDTTIKMFLVNYQFLTDCTFTEIVPFQTIFLTLKNEEVKGFSFPIFVQIQSYIFVIQVSAVMAVVRALFMNIALRYFKAGTQKANTKALIKIALAKARVAYGIEES